MKFLQENKNVLAVGVLCLAFGYLFATTYNKNDMSMEADMHAHNHIQVAPGKKDPTVSVEVLKDTMAGYNLHIVTTNFTFTPSDAGKSPVQNTGHAHVYVNGKKIGRAYGDWYYIGKDNFHPGTNMVTVSLNANDHSDWVASDGKTEISASTVVDVN